MRKGNNQNLMRLGVFSACLAACVYMYPWSSSGNIPFFWRLNSPNIIFSAPLPRTRSAAVCDCETAINNKNTCRGARCGVVTLILKT